MYKIRQKNILSLVVGGIAFFLAGCIDEVDPKGLVDSETMIVVNGVLSPQSEFFTVDVSESEPVFGKRNLGDDLTIRDAVVTLSNGDEERELELSADEYTIALTELFPIEAGKTYYLKVIAKGKTLTAECTVPEKAVVSDVKFIEAGDNDRVRVRWQDFATVANFYRLAAEIVMTRPGFDGSLEEASSNVDFSPTEFITDNRVDGQLMSFAGDTYLYQDNSWTLAKANVQLVTGDENYYDYFRTLEQYDYYGDDPFSEPFQLNSNIEGGLGLFAAFQISEQEIDF